MQETNKFPLLSTYLSLDLVNTEVVRRGKRIDLLLTEEDIWSWLEMMEPQLQIIDVQRENFEKNITKIKEKLLYMRAWLREQYEWLANTGKLKADFILFLEGCIEKAPIVYTWYKSKLIAVPIGKPEEMLVTLIALDALKLMESKKLFQMKHCANEDCVLLFLDESGRRKWCSMKICGNRKKVAKFQENK